MGVNCNRVHKKVEPFGFCQRLRKMSAHDCAFVRPDEMKGLYQHLEIWFQGRRREAVYAYTGVDITQHVGLSNKRRHLVPGIATNVERQWSVIHDDQQAKAWENRLCELIPAIFAAVSVSERQGLLTETQSSRDQAMRCLARLSLAESLEEQVRSLGSRHPKLIARANQLADIPGVMCIAHADDLFVVACLLILLDEESAPLARDSPLDNPELWSLINLVADGILSHSDYLDEIMLK